MNVSAHHFVIFAAAIGFTSAAQGFLPGEPPVHKLSVVAAQLAPKVALIRMAESDAASAVRTAAHPEFEMYFTALQNVRSCSPAPKYGRIEFSHCPSLRVYTASNGHIQEHHGDYLVSSTLNHDLAAIVRVDDRFARPLRRKLEAHIDEALLPPGIAAGGSLYCVSFSTESSFSGPTTVNLAGLIDHDFMSLRDQMMKEFGMIGDLLPPGQGMEPASHDVLRAPIVTRGMNLTVQNYRMLALAEERAASTKRLSTDDVLYTPIDASLWLVVSRVSSLRLAGKRLETNCEGLAGSSGGGVFRPNGDVIGITSAGNASLNPLHRQLLKGLRHTPLTHDRVWVPFPLSRLWQKQGGH